MDIDEEYDKIKIKNFVKTKYKDLIKPTNDAGDYYEIERADLNELAGEEFDKYSYLSNDGSESLSILDNLQIKSEKNNITESTTKLLFRFLPLDGNRNYYINIDLDNLVDGLNERTLVFKEDREYSTITNKSDNSDGSQYTNTTDDDSELVAVSSDEYAKKYYLIPVTIIEPKQNLGGKRKNKSKKKQSKKKEHKKKSQKKKRKSIKTRR